MPKTTDNNHIRFLKMKGELSDPARLSNATADGHKHLHNPTYKASGPALTHAWYRRHNKPIPTRTPAGKMLRHVRRVARRRLYATKAA